MTVPHITALGMIGIIGTSRMSGGPLQADSRQNRKNGNNRFSRYIRPAFEIALACPT